MPRLGENARAGLAPAATLAVDIAGWTVGGTLAGVAWARGGRPVHPHGAVNRARLVVEGARHAPAASRLLATEAEHAALVRFLDRSVCRGRSRTCWDCRCALWAPTGEGRHQDFLVVTSMDLPVLHHVFVPAGDFQRRVYSSSLPYRAGDTTFIVGAVPDPRSPRPAGEDELDRLARAAATGDPRSRSQWRAWAAGSAAWRPSTWASAWPRTRSGSTLSLRRRDASGRDDQPAARLRVSALATHAPRKFAKPGVGVARAK